MPPHVVIIFEDVMGDAKARDKVIDELAGLGRHYYMSVYILVQSKLFILVIAIVAPLVRSQIVFVAFFVPCPMKLWNCYKISLQQLPTKIALHTNLL